MVAVRKAGFSCNVCYHCCTTKASELLEDPAVEKTGGEGGTKGWWWEEVELNVR